MQFKGQNEKLIGQLKDIEEGNILVPKEKNPRSDGKHGSGELNDKLHAELKRLYALSRHKEDMIARVAAMPNLPEEVRAVLEEGERQNHEKDSYPSEKFQEQESRVKAALLLEGEATQEELKEYLTNSSGSFLLSETEVEKLMAKQSELQTRLRKEGEEKESLEVQLATLQEDLKRSLENQKVDLENITQSIVEQRLNEQQKKYDYEKTQILRDLQNRVDKVVKLEMALDDAKESYRALENSLTKDDRTFKKHIAKLERNLEQITLMYHQVVSEKSVLKVDLQVAEKKIMRKEDKVVSLERSVGQLREQNQQLKAILHLIKNNYQPGSAQEEDQITKIEKNNLTGIPSSGRIVKPIRGGKSGKKLATPRGMSAAQTQLVNDLIQGKMKNN